MNHKETFDFFTTFTAHFCFFCAKTGAKSPFLLYFYIKCRHFATQVVVVSQILEQLRFAFQHIRIVMRIIDFQHSAGKRGSLHQRLLRCGQCQLRHKMPASKMVAECSKHHSCCIHLALGRIACNMRSCDIYLI